jgi:hypothetical protein
MNYLHKEILFEIEKLSAEHPDWRFGQILNNSGVLEFANENNNLRDIFYDEDIHILAKLIKTETFVVKDTAEALEIKDKISKLRINLLFFHEKFQNEFEIKICNKQGSILYLLNQNSFINKNTKAKVFLNGEHGFDQLSNSFSNIFSVLLKVLGLWLTIFLSIFYTYIFYLFLLQIGLHNHRYKYK